MRLLLVLTAALALAAPVGGAPKPAAELFVNALDTRPGARAETDVYLSLAAAATSVTVYVPAGFVLDLDRRPGSLIGSLTVTSARERHTASLFTAERSIWTDGDLRIAVAREAGSYSIAFAPPPAAVDVDLDLRGALTNPAVPTVATWRAVVTPTRGPEFELRSIVAVPQTLTLQAAVARGRLRLGGRLLFSGKARAGVNVHLAVATLEDLSDARELGVARTRADGRYALVRPLSRRGHLFVLASVNFYDGACSGPPSTPGGCARQSIAPPPSAYAAITIPPRRHDPVPADA